MSAESERPACPNCGAIPEVAARGRTLAFCAACDIAYSHDGMIVAAGLRSFPRIDAAVRSFYEPCAWPKGTFKDHHAGELRDATPHEREVIEAMIGHPVVTLRVPFGGIPLRSEDGYLINDKTLVIDSKAGGHMTIRVARDGTVEPFEDRG